MVPHKKRQEYSLEKEIEKEVEEILKGEDVDLFAEEVEVLSEDTS